MSVKGNTSSIVIGSVLLLILLFSLFVYFFIWNNWERRILFFPEIGSEKLSGEKRFLPSRKTLEEDVQFLLEEAILGPANPIHERILPKEVHLKSVITHQGTIYVDLSREMIFAEKELHLSLDEMIQAIGNIVLFNFPGVKHLFIFVDGRQPGRLYTDGVQYNPKILK